MLNTTKVILEAMAQSKGFTGGNSATFLKVTEAVSEGHHILSVLANPLSFGVTPSCVRFIEQFAAAHEIADRLVRPRREMILAAKASINHMSVAGQSLRSTLDYTQFYLDQSFQQVAESHLSDVLADAKTTAVELIRLSGNQVTRNVRLMTHVFYVDLFVSSDEEADPSPDLIEIQKRMMLEGFEYVNAHGEIRRAHFLLQSASQSRTLQAIFVDGDVASMMRQLGHDLRAYAKCKDGEYQLDITKMLKRPGLSGSSSQHAKLIRFGKDIVETAEGYRIEGGNMTLEVIRDRSALIKTGTYKIFNAKTKQFDVMDASTDPYLAAAGDGLIFCDEEVYFALKAYFNTTSDAWQVRITPFGKGLMVFVPGLRQFYDANVVMTASSVKGDFRSVVESHDIQLRICLFNKDITHTPATTSLPYQFTHGMAIKASELNAIADRRFQEVKADLSNPEALARRVGIKPSMMDQDVYDLPTTFGVFMAHVPFASKDLWMQTKATDLLQLELDGYLGGTIAVNGHYRFMVQDPYAILAAKDGQLDHKGRLIVSAHTGLQANQAFLVNRDEVIPVGQEFVLARNPLVTRGEMPLVTIAAPGRYVNDRRAFRNLLVMSCHDFGTIRMGGADNDGDTALAMNDVEIVHAVKRHAHLPAIIDDGCPYSDPTIDLAQYQVSFTNYNVTVDERIHALSRQYVLATMQPNKIGLITNVATKLADAVRSIAAKMETQPDHLRTHSLNTINRFLEMIDLLRICQGWEIDRAKHGGAYESELKTQLDFIANPPVEASVMDLTGNRHYILPEWLGYRRGQKGIYTDSVLCRVHRHVQGQKAALDKHIDALKHVLSGVVVDGYKQVPHLIGELTGAIAMTQDRFARIRDAIAPIKQKYAVSFKQLIQEKDQLEKEAKRFFNRYAYEREMELIETQFADASIDVIEAASSELRTLERFYAPHEIGYVAYVMTYTGFKKVKSTDAAGNEKEVFTSINFPWTAGKRQLIAALMKVNGNLRTIPFETKEGSFQLAFGVLDHGDKVVHALLAAQAIDIRLERSKSGNMLYAIYIPGMEQSVGFLMDCHMHKLAGNQTLSLRVNHASFNGQHTVSVTVSF